MGFNQNALCSAAYAESCGLVFISLINGKIDFAGDVSDLPDFLIHANECYSAGDYTEVCVLLEQASEPGFESFLNKSDINTDIMFLVAKLYFDIGRLDKAEIWNKRILEYAQHGLVFHQLFLICSKNTERLTEAVMYAEKALDCMPDELLFRVELSKALALTGQVDRALDVLEQGIEARSSDFCLYQPLMWWKHYMASMDPNDMLQGYCSYAKRAFTGSSVQLDCCVFDPHKHLRIGFISPDFRDNSLAYTFEPFLDGVNKENLEIYGYGRVAREDCITERIKRKFQYYRDVFGMSAQEIAALITNDQIDILVLLGGYVNNNAVDVCALKPAPVQADFGSISTIGLDQLEYRITDRNLDPVENKSFYHEDLVYLPHSSIHYRAPDLTPAVNALPAVENGFITFGSFNNNAKINDFTVSMWASVLLKCPGSRLVLKFIAGADSQVRNMYQDKFAHYGVDPQRVCILGFRSSTYDSFACYHRIDLALDTYPFNGGITTLESLWMGVPVVTLSGQTMHSRMSLNILNTIGLDSFVCSDRTEFINKSVAFSKQLEHLQTIRHSLRAMMLNSSICDDRLFALDMENVFKQIWAHACKRRHYCNCLNS